ncbi:MAG TPA: hypothetical protein P5551_06250 [Syntrophales bacterium]|nr:hypothetical protein [Syntrophales bacterium]
MSRLKLVLSALILVMLAAPPLHAETSSCRTVSGGKLNCMEFAETLKPGLAKVCGIVGPNSKWVKAPCPRKNAPGACRVTRSDGIEQPALCYRMTGLPDGQRIDFCRKSCKGTFVLFKAK